MLVLTNNIIILQWTCVHCCYIVYLRVGHHMMQMLASTRTRYIRLYCAWSIHKLFGVYNYVHEQVWSKHLYELQYWGQTFELLNIERSPWIVKHGTITGSKARQRVCWWCLWMVSHERFSKGVQDAFIGKLKLILCRFICFVSPDEEMDGKAIQQAYATCSDPDCIRDVISKFGQRLDWLHAWCSRGGPMHLHVSTCRCMAGPCTCMCLHACEVHWAVPEVAGENTLENISTTRKRQSRM